MTLNIPLDATVENRLRDRAQRAGIDVTEFVRRLLDQAAREDATAEFDSVLDELFAADQQSPPAASSTHPRSEIYADGD
jgi:antitoxin component of RelBE/YafQ-DinJ toxin-antitoxin module